MSLGGSVDDRGKNVVRECRPSLGLGDPPLVERLEVCIVESDPLERTVDLVGGVLSYARRKGRMAEFIPSPLPGRRGPMQFC